MTGQTFLPLKQSLTRSMFVREYTPLSGEGHEDRGREK
jgi:hypothetical protein